MPDTLPLTAIIIAKNESDNLTSCLTSLSFASEIILADDHSEDNTVALAKKAGAKVITLDKTISFAAKRNQSLAHASFPWVLFIDADERIAPECVSEIKVATKDNTINGYYLPRTDVFMGKPLFHGETGHIRLLRLAKKDAGIWERNVHEVWKIKGRVGELHSGLLHTPHRNISAFIDTINLYTSIEASSRPLDSRLSLIFQILTYPFGKFLFNFLLLAGYLDGTRGFFHALLMSLHSLSVRIKTWERYAAS